MSKTPMEDFIYSPEAEVAEVAPAEHDTTAAELHTETTAIASEVPQIEPTPSSANDDITNANIRQRQYIARSQVCDGVGTVAPVSLLYDMNRTLTALDRKVNGVDNYIMAKLGYKNLIELCQAFSKEQIDALALIIHNGEERGFYTIEGDMTGVGKGRVGAGLMRYAAVSLGKKPILFTEKANLFSDFFRDIIDINFDSGIPLEWNTGKTREIAKKISGKDIVERIESDIDCGEFDKEYNTATLFNSENKEELRACIEEYREEFFPNDIVEETIYRENKNYDYDILKDGVKRFVPFILNSNDSSKRATIKDKNGNIIYEPHTSSEKADKRKILLSGELPDGYDCVLTTYSQISSTKAFQKRAFLMEIARNNVVIFDESHNASGNSNTGRYLSELIATTKAGTFMSATYAKRPENMVIYAEKTCLADAELPAAKLTAAIDRGGVPLQEIISTELAAEGLMVRRERSYENVKVAYNYFDKSMTEMGMPEFDLAEAHALQADKVTGIVRDIIKFQDTHIKEIVAKVKEDLKGLNVGQTSQQDMATVNNPPLFNGVFNLINQMLFSLKAKTVANWAIMRMKEGKKPVIAFASTMESFLDYLAASTTEDTIPTDFSIVLKRRLDKVMTYAIKYPSGETAVHSIDPDSMSPDGQLFYYDILQKIEDTVVGMDISPIDTILNTIKDAGFAVGEVTGRNKYVQYLPNGRGRIKTRQKPSASDVFRKFNENEYDCILINQAGSTGASAHAIKNEKVFEVNYTESGIPIVPKSLENKHEVKQRTCLILQAELDINKEVQKRGRINRTGQVFGPIYEYLTSSIPAETRLMMMLQKKLKSLDANTSGNQKQSSSILSVIDFLNKYGDQVVLDFLKANKEINFLTGNLAKLGPDGAETDGTNKEDLAHRVSGRIAILSVEQQQQFYDEVSRQYMQLEEYLRNCDEWNLELGEPLKLNATTVSKDVVEVGNAGTKSVFGGPVMMETVWADNLRQPYSRDMVKQMMDRTLTIASDRVGEEGIMVSPQEFKNALLSDLEIYIKADLEKWLNYKLLNKESNIEKLKNSNAYLKIEDEAAKVLFYDEAAKKIEEDYRRWVKAEIELSEMKHSKITGLINFYQIGRLINYPMWIETDKVDVRGIVVGFKVNKLNWHLSEIKVKIAFPSSLKQIEVIGSSQTAKEIVTATNWDAEIRTHEKWKVNRFLDEWDFKIKDDIVPRLKRTIITGNLLKAISKTEFATGKLISYTTSDGKLKKGILLSNAANALGAMLQNDPAKMPVKVPIYAMIDKIQTMKFDEKFTISSEAFLMRKMNDYKLFVQLGAKGKGSIPADKDEELQQLTIQGKFEKRNGFWEANIAPGIIQTLVTILWEKYKITADVPRAYFELIKDAFDIDERGTETQATESEILDKYNQELVAYEKEQEELAFKHQTETDLLAKSQAERQAYSQREETEKLKIARHYFHIYMALDSFKKEKEWEAKKLTINN